MKTIHTALSQWTATGLSMLAATVTFRALADDSTAAVKPEKTRTGTVESVNAQEHTLRLKGYFFSKTFNLGDNCAYRFVDKDKGAIGDVHPGHRMKVRYQDAQGVLVADRVTQQPMSDEGMVKAIDPAQHVLTLRYGMMDKRFQLPDDCAVTLRGGKTGTLADIQPGNHVTVTYEIPNDKATAREIAQSSATFSGELTAIDLDQKTLKARALLDTKKFIVGDDCAIVVNGKPDGKLSDLKPTEELVLSYNNINGVNIVDRIAPANAASKPMGVAANKTASE
jgi:hypothetical protein